MADLIIYGRAGPVSPLRRAFAISWQHAASFTMIGAMEPTSSGFIMDEILVCGFQSCFPDDAKGKCACGREIVFRPHLAHVKHKVCMSCGYLMMAKQKDPVEINIPTKVRQEINEFLRSRDN